MKIIVTTGKRIQPVHVPAEVLLALTDALHLCPEATFDEIVRRAQRLRRAYETAATRLKGETSDGSKQRQ